MKQELKDIAVQVAVSTPTTGYAWLTQISIAEWVAITLGVLQALYLLRKWWREETSWGLRMKRWAVDHGMTPTKPQELD